MLIIRILLHMYLFHFTKVAWKARSNSFRVLNGVSQGAILALFYFVFILTLYWPVWVKLEQVVTLVIFLLVHSHMPMTLFNWPPVRTLCGIFCGYVMITRPSLTLCLMPVNPNVCAAPPAGAAKQVTPADSLPSFSIGSRVIEFVDKWPDLGHIITKECTDTDDILNKKSSLITQINKVLYNFRKVNYQTKTRLVKTYCTSFYGAKFWDLSRSNIESICIAWWKGIRCIWQLPCIRFIHDVLHVNIYLYLHLHFQIPHILYYYQSLAILCRCLICFLYACWVLSRDVFVANLHWLILWSVMGYYMDKWIPL